MRSPCSPGQGTRSTALNEAGLCFLGGLGSSGTAPPPADSLALLVGQEGWRHGHQEALLSLPPTLRFGRAGSALASWASRRPPRGWLRASAFTDAPRAGLMAISRGACPPGPAQGRGMPPPSLPRQWPLTSSVPKSVSTADMEPVMATDLCLGVGEGGELGGSHRWPRWQVAWWHLHVALLWRRPQHLQGSEAAPRMPLPGFPSPKTRRSPRDAPSRRSRAKAFPSLGGPWELKEEKALMCVLV